MSTLGYGYDLRDRLPLACPVCDAGAVEIRSERPSLADGYAAQWDHRARYECGNATRLVEGMYADRVQCAEMCRRAYRVASDLLAERRAAQDIRKEAP